MPHSPLKGMNDMGAPWPCNEYLIPLAATSELPHFWVQALLLLEAQKEALALQREMSASSRSQHSSKDTPPWETFRLAPQIDISTRDHDRKGSRISCEMENISGPMSSSAISLLVPAPTPSGWEIAADDAGNEFYFNDLTGESRWDRPPTPVTVDSGGDDSHHALLLCSPEHSQSGNGAQASPSPKTESNSGTPVGGNLSVSDGQLSLVAEGIHSASPPDGWEALNADDGSVFFHNIASGLTQWEFPQLDQEASVPSVGGVCAWEEFATDEGMPFWYNATTEESSWLSPEASAG